MARADLILALAKAALRGDRAGSRRAIEAIAAEEAQKRHTVLARQLSDEVEAADSSPPAPAAALHLPTNTSAFTEVMPKLRLRDLHLPSLVQDQLTSLIEEQNRFELLRSYGLEPRHRVLLTGPPGNGKTSCAEALASELALPLLVIRYDQVITSYLGETASQLTRALSEAKRRHCVLFLDEFDVLAKERSDENEHGEVKRLVSSLLLALDDLPSYVILVAATNHADLLDSAVWRRFDILSELPSPSAKDRLSFAATRAESLRVGVSKTSLNRFVKRLGDISFAELEAALTDLRRREILQGLTWSDVDIDRVLDHIVVERRAMRRKTSAASGADSTDDKPR